MFRSFGPWLLLLACLGAATPSLAATARVTYVTSKTVYVDAGLDQGLAMGAVVTVVRDGEVLGEAVVQEVSRRRAACAWRGGDVLPVVGDMVRFEEAEEIADASSEGSWWRRQGLRGRIGLQSLHIRDRSGFGRDLDRPALDLRMRGHDVAGSGLDLEADVRARRTSVGDATRSNTRVYRLNAESGDVTDGLSWAVGRQFAPAVSVFHLFDGARVQYGREAWSVGALAGSQPDPVDLGLSGQVVEGGLYAVRRSVGDGPRWSVTTAAIASYDEGEIAREFVYAQGSWSTSAWWLRLDQEVDLNRGWKSDAGESLLSSTSTLFSARWTVERDWTVDFGFDNRRRVRLLRDRTTPQTEFDDAYRRGTWIGLRSRPWSTLDLGLRAQTRRGGGSESADLLTFTAGYRGRWARPWRVSSRTTVYRNELVEGWLQSGRLRVSPSPRLHLGAFGGVRQENGRSNDLMDGTDPWLGLDADFDLRHDLWLSLSWERSFEDEEAFEQIWLGSGLRF